MNQHPIVTRAREINDAEYHRLRLLIHWYMSGSKMSDREVVEHFMGFVRTHKLGYGYFPDSK